MGIFNLREIKRQATGPTPVQKRLIDGAAFRTEIHADPEYCASLKEHAVPLDENHIACLSHSGMAFDIYAWLAQRLHRIPINAPAHVSWTALHEQFGQGYNHLNNFRAAFRVALKEVLALYRDARIEDEDRKPARTYWQDGRAVLRAPPAKGLTLHYSSPPVSRRR